MRQLQINSQAVEVNVPDELPLLRVLSHESGRTGIQNGCDMALRGADTTQLDVTPARARERLVMRKSLAGSVLRREPNARIATAGAALLLGLACAVMDGSAALGADANPVGAGPKRSAEANGEDMVTMKIKLTIDGKVVTGTLVDNATSRDFLSLLPVALTLEDYAATEKISYLPRKLSTSDSPAGIDPSVGDITYYAPWGNLAIFHKDAGYARGLVRLGRIDSGLEALAAPGPMKVMIERVGRK